MICLKLVYHINRALNVSITFCKSHSVLLPAVNSPCNIPHLLTAIEYVKNIAYFCEQLRAGNHWSRRGLSAITRDQISKRKSCLLQTDTIGVYQAGTIDENNKSWRRAGTRQANKMSWQLFGDIQKCADTSFVYIPGPSLGILKCPSLNIISVSLFIFFVTPLSCLICVANLLAHDSWWRVLRVCWLLVTFFAFFFYFEKLFCRFPLIWFAFFWTRGDPVIDGDFSLGNRARMQKDVQ